MNATINVMRQQRQALKDQETDFFNNYKKDFNETRKDESDFQKSKLELEADLRKLSHIKETDERIHYTHHM